MTVAWPLLSRCTNGTSPPIKISAVSPESIEIFGSAKILPFDWSSKALMKAASPGAVIVNPPCAPLYPPPKPKLPPKTALPLPLKGPRP